MLKPTSFFERVNPALKFVIFFVITISTIFIHSLKTLSFLVCCALLLYLLFSSMKWRWRLVLLLPFILLSFTSGITVMLFGLGDDVLFQFWWWRISSESLLNGSVIMLRTLYFSLLGLSFATTTNPVLFFYALMQQFRVPTFIAYSFLTVFRLLPIMMEEFTLLTKAMRVRGMHKQRGLAGLVAKLKRYSITMLSQSIRRAFKISVAMSAKKFKKGPRSFYYITTYSRNDFYYVLLWLVVIGSCLFFT